MLFRKNKKNISRVELGYQNLIRRTFRRRRRGWSVKRRRLHRNKLESVEKEREPISLASRTQKGQTERLKSKRKNTNQDLIQKVYYCA